MLNKRGGDFDNEDQALLEALTGHAAATLESLQLYEDIQRVLRDETRLLGITMALSKELKLDALLAKIMSITSDVLEADRSTLLLYDEPSGELRSKFAEGLETSQASFTQTVRSQDGRLQDQTSGRIWLQVPDKLRWAYQGEFPETIVADGENIWIHDVALEQVTVKPQSDQASDSPLLVLADITRLDEQFSVTELGEVEDMALLELRSLDAESEFERILLGFGDEGVRLMAMEDAFGQRTEVHFSDAARNETLAPELFTFTPPEGADVVGDPRLQQ